MHEDRAGGLSSSPGSRGRGPPSPWMATTVITSPDARRSLGGANGVAQDLMPAASGSPDRAEPGPGSLAAGTWEPDNGLAPGGSPPLTANVKAGDAHSCAIRNQGIEPRPTC